MAESALMSCGSHPLSQPPTHTLYNKLINATRSTRNFPSPHLSLIIIDYSFLPHKNKKSNFSMASSIGSTFAGAAPSCARFKHHLHQPSRISAVHAAAGRTSTSTSHIAPQTSLYEVLGIPMGATCQEIKAAYRRLARVLHPDVASSHNSTRGSQDTSAAADEFMTVHKAYTTLSDPEKRADYDRTLFRLRRPAYVLSATNRGSGCYTRRTWETDQCW